MKLGAWLLLLVFVALAQPGSGSAQRALVQPCEPANALRDRGTRWALVAGISAHQYLRPDGGSPVGQAAEAYDAYVLLAPNYADAADVRASADRARTLANRPAPSLRR